MTFFNGLNLGGFRGESYSYSIIGSLNGKQEIDLTGVICASGSSSTSVLYSLIACNGDKINDLKIDLDLGLLLRRTCLLGEPPPCQ